MTEIRTLEIKVGLVSIAGILLLIVGITLGKGYNVSVSQKTIAFRFQNSGGIQESAPIMVNGVKRGYVSSVKNDQGTVRITGLVDDVDDFRNDIFAKILILEITGGKKIEINPGINTVKFDISKEIHGENTADIADLVAMVGEVSGDAKQLIRRLDTISGAATQLLADGKVVSQLRQTVENASHITQLMSNQLDKSVGDIDMIITNTKKITNILNETLKKNEPKIELLLTQLDETLNSARKLMTDAKKSLGNVDTLMFSFNSLAKDIKYGDGFVPKLLFDKQYGQKLDSTFTSLQQLLELIKQYGVNVNLRLGTRP